MAGAFGSGVVKSATGRRLGRRGDAGVGCGIGVPNDHEEVVDVRRTGVLSLVVDARPAAVDAGSSCLGVCLGRRNDGLEIEIADILPDLRAEVGVAASSTIVTVAGLLLGPEDSESPPLGVLPSTLKPLSPRSGILGRLESRVASAKALPAASCSISSSTTASIVGRGCRGFLSSLCACRQIYLRGGHT